MSIEDGPNRPDWEELYRQKLAASEHDLATRSANDWATSMRRRQRLLVSRDQPLPVEGGSNLGDPSSDEFGGLSSAEMLQRIRDEADIYTSEIVGHPTLSFDEKKRALHESMGRVTDMSRAHRDVYGTYGLFEIMEEDNRQKEIGDNS